MNRKAKGVVPAKKHSDHINDRLSANVINLESRLDRRNCIERQFEGRTEFDCNILSVKRNPNGAKGLWDNIRAIISEAAICRKKFVIVCEDDHVFTRFYSKRKFFAQISLVDSLEGDVLLGGVSWCESAVPVDESVYWIEHFSGTQFMLIFSRFYEKILNVHFGDNDNADSIISGLTTRKYLIHPFISIQKDFGYSDVTVKNNHAGAIQKLFLRSSKTIEIIKKMMSWSKEIAFKPSFSKHYNFSLTTYIIENKSDNPDRSDSDFKIRQEFNSKIVKLKNGKRDLELWKVIKSICQNAINDKEDVIIITNSDQKLTLAYSKDMLFRNIFECHQIGADLLLGNLTYFSQAVPVGKGKYWIDRFFGLNFIICFKNVFQTIVQSEYKGSVPLDLFISSLTGNKFVLHPFITNQSEEGADDRKANTEELIAISQNRLKTINEKYLEFGKSCLT